MRLVALILFVFSHTLYAQSGELKIDFGVSGKMTLDIDDVDHLVGLDRDEQGNTFFYGNTSEYQGGAYPFDIFFGKLDQTGALDLSFGSAGLSRLDFPGFEVSTLNQAIYHSNSIYFIGQGYNHTSQDTFGLFIGKLKANGEIDTTFADNGFFTSDFLGAYNSAGSLIVDSNNRLVFCGSTTHDSGTNLEFPLVGRLNLDGELDSTFGNTGLVVYDYYQDSIIDAYTLPAYNFRHGEGAYLSEIVAYNNAYFVAGKYVGTSFSLLHFMSFDQTGGLNPNFVTSGLYPIQEDPGANHFLQDIAFDGSTFHLAFETQGMYDGSYLVKQIDTTGVLGDTKEIHEAGFDSRVRFIDSWNDKIFVGGYHLDDQNAVPGHLSDNSRIHCLDGQMSIINSFDFTENLGAGEEEGAEDIVLHDDFGVIAGYTNNVSGSNVTDIYFMAFDLYTDLGIETFSADFELYPNPCTEDIFSTSKMGEYKIFTLTGELVLSGTSEQRIDVSELASGSYVLHLLDTDYRSVVVVR